MRTRITILLALLAWGWFVPSSVSAQAVNYYPPAVRIEKAASSGGTGSPGGSNTQVQYNNSGAFAGDASFTWDSVAKTLTLPTVTVSGQTVSGSGTDSAVSIASTWNTTGAPTAILLNVTSTASSTAALLMDLRVGGTSKFAVDKYGSGVFASGAAIGAESNFVWQGRSRFTSGSSGSIEAWAKDGTTPSAFKAGQYFSGGVAGCTGTPTAATGGIATGCSDAVEIASFVPGTTTNKLYNNAGTLMWNGSAVGGGSGSPGGSDTQVQYNNAGAFGGSANFAYNATTGLLTVAGQSTSAGALSLTTPSNMTGGTAFTVTQGSRLSGTPIIADFRSGVSSILQVAYNGYVTVSGSPRVIFDNTNQYIRLGDVGPAGLYYYANYNAAGAGHIFYGHDGVSGSREKFRIENGGSTSFLWTLRSDGSNYEGLKFNLAAGVVGLEAVTAGTGTDDVDIAFVPAGAGLVKIGPALNTSTSGGSTASFTANMVGSSGGPTTAGQNGWLKLKDAGGATIWVPVWK